MSALWPPGVVASWVGVVLAESSDTVVVDGNHYFPAAAVDHGLLMASATRTVCGWKGIAHYASLVVDGEVLSDAVWWYPEPFPAAAAVAGRYAFGAPVAVGPLWAGPAARSSFPLEK